MNELGATALTFMIFKFTPNHESYFTLTSADLARLRRAHCGLSESVLAEQFVKSVVAGVDAMFVLLSLIHDALLPKPQTPAAAAQSAPRCPRVDF